MAMKSPVAVLCLVWLCLQHGVEAKKIFMLPMNIDSHVFYFLEIGEGLIQQGHEVYMLLSPNYKRPPKVDQAAVKLIFYNPVAPEPILTTNKDTQRVVINNILQDPDKYDYVDMYRMHGQPFRNLCTNALGDKDLFIKLKKMNFDFALMGGVIPTRCLYVLCYKLGIPYGSITSFVEPWMSRTPGLPSFVPFHLRTSYTEKMTFWQRLHNFYKIVDFYAWPRIPFLDDSFVTTYAPEKPVKTLSYLAGQSQIWFINTDVAIDYPNPLMPNVIPVGGLSTHPAKPLAPDFENIVKAAKHGFILVTFGAYINYLPEYVLKNLVTAFGQVKQAVIFRWANPEEIKNPPRNVFVFPWVPQNDLLGHPKSRLFITHCGNNGQFEALYHGVPMIGFPIMVDQPYNAARMQYKGYGLVMSFSTFTAEELAKNINKVIEDKAYKENIMLGSEIYKSQEMTPKERAMYWLEHVMEFGGDHLHSHALEMPWYEYMMLDILLFIMVCLSVAIYLIYQVGRLVIRLLLGGQTRKVKTQ